MSQPEPKQWEPWKGGSCPVSDPASTLVDVELQDGRIIEGVYASEFRWNHETEDDPKLPVRVRGNIVNWRISVLAPARFH